jgi:hypothetical protein
MRKLFFLLTLLFMTCEVHANPWVRSEEIQPIMFQPQLYGGTRSLPTEFLPMAWIGNCTATAVSRRTAFTAAHCVTNGKRINFHARFDGVKYPMTCKRHPKVNTRSWHNDFAFCTIDSGGQFPAAMPIATFNLRKPAVGEKLLLNGYGAPTAGTAHQWGDETVDEYEGQDIVMCGPTYLGGGDSGGSLLAWTDDRTGKLVMMEILGVNSRGGGDCSLFNTVADGELKSFALAIESETGDKLCGISANCAGSPQPSPTPSPSPSPSRPSLSECWKTYDQFAFCMGLFGHVECLKKADTLKACVR